MTDQPQRKKIRLVFRGTVASAHGSKTIVVTVERSKLHPTYLKRYKVSKKYKVHDERNQYKVGDAVRFVETRPLSKDKRWRVLYDQPAQN